VAGAYSVLVISVGRFLRRYLRPEPAAAKAVASSYERGGERVEATVFRPLTGARRLPGWLLLHGLTYRGREHASLVRFAQAVAATGRIVFVPDIPEWRALRVAPAVTVPTIQAAIRALHDRDDVDPDHTGMMGFSFGATQGLVAASDPEVGRLLHGAVAWGGYYDLRALFRFGLNGEFFDGGRRMQLQPDPYGCWVMAGNYLTRVPGFEEFGDVAAAVHELATESGRRGSFAWEPVYDAAKLRLRATLAPEKRATFDMLAPLTTEPVEATPETVAMAEALADAAAETDPLLVPAPHLPKLAVPTLIAHGRDDRLVPYTESLALADALPGGCLRDVTVTGLFAHSGGTLRGVSPFAKLREVVRFVRMLDRMLKLVD
jgi:pimeloyl-ACP methyl ester carboxylesterase